MGLFEYKNPNVQKIQMWERACSLPQVWRTHDRSHALRGNAAGDALRPTRSQPSAVPTEAVHDVMNAPEPRALAVSYL